MNRALMSALVFKLKLSNGRLALWLGIFVSRYLRRQRISCAITLFSSLLVIGCGFEPLLARNAGGLTSDDLARIRVHTIADRSGQILRNYLLDDLTPRGGPAVAGYTLQIRLSEPQQQIAVRRDESASRVAYTAVAAFFLQDRSGETIYSGTSTSSSTYEATNSEFASISGQLSARDRAMQEISADIRQQLAAYFDRVRRGVETNASRP